MPEQAKPKGKGGRKVYRTELDLPIPPSTNRLWRHGQGRTFLSQEYTSWIKSAGWELAAQKPTPIPSPVAVTLKAGIPGGRRRDLDNIAKAALDLLERHGVVTNDATIVDLRLTWDKVVPAGRMRVSLWRTTEPTARPGAEGRARVSAATKAAFAEAFASRRPAA